MAYPQRKLLWQQFQNLTDWDTEAGAAEADHARGVHGDDFALAVEDRAAAAAGCRLCIVDDPSRDDISDVSLRGQGPNAFLIRKLLHQLPKIVAGSLRQSPSRLFFHPRQEAFDPDWIAQHHDGFAGDALRGRPSDRNRRDPDRGRGKAP
jgi:hypothetical protein